MADTAEQTENQEQEKSTEQKSTEQKDGDNQKAIDDAVAAAKEKWEKEVEEKLKKAEEEGMRKAKLTADQRKKEDDDKERAEFEKAKAEFEREKIIAYAETELAKVGLSAEIAKDSTKAVIDKIKESYDKDVQAGVTERLKGKTPDLNGGSGGHNTGSFMDIIRENQR